MLAKNINVGDKLKMLHDRHSSKGNIVIQAGSIVEVLEIDKSDCMVQLLIRQPNQSNKFWTSARYYEKVIE